MCSKAQPEWELRVIGRLTFLDRLTSFRGTSQSLQANNATVLQSAIIIIIVDRESVAGIANPYDWTVLGSNPGDGEIFRTCTVGPGVHPAFYTMGTRSLARG